MKATEQVYIYPNAIECTHADADKVFCVFVLSRFMMDLLAKLSRSRGKLLLSRMRKIIIRKI